MSERRPRAHRRSGPRRAVTQETAASLVGVPPEMLEAWRARFGFPRSMLLDGDQAFYSRRELIALRDGLDTQSSIPSAIAHALDVSGLDPAAC